MNLDYLQSDPGPDIYYTPQAHVVIEDHLTLLREDSETIRITIEPHICVKYRGDLFGLLRFARVPPYLHYATMRVNFMSSPIDYNSTTTELLVPSDNALTKIINSFQTYKKISL